MAVEVLEQLRSISGQQSKIRRMREKLALFRQVHVVFGLWQWSKYLGGTAMHFWVPPGCAIKPNLHDPGVPPGGGSAQTIWNG